MFVQLFAQTDLRFSALPAYRQRTNTIAGARWLSAVAVLELPPPKGRGNSEHGNPCVLSLTKYGANAIALCVQTDAQHRNDVEENVAHW
ncbi:MULTISPECIES: hypothetical protein [Pandoraea]|uniref:hypothetical protein n=1 Tax=Pandoraea TaxID=93217 RepID=UPI0012415023|nr:MULTISPECIES: hypothetical protein [Pandoraea]